MQKILRIAFAAALVATPLLGGSAAAMEAFVDENGNLAKPPEEPSEERPASSALAPAGPFTMRALEGGGTLLHTGDGLMKTSRAHVHADGSVSVECGSDSHGDAR